MSKLKGKGSILELEVATVFTAITQILSIDGPVPDVETFDSTDLSTTGAGKELLPTGYAAPGEVSFECFFDPALSIHQSLLDLVNTPAVVDWKLKFSDAGPTTWPFSGVFKGMGPKIAMNDGVKASGKIALSGLPTYP